MIEHMFCKGRQTIDKKNNCSWIVKGDDGLWYAKCIDKTTFVYDLEIIYCPYCGFIK